MLKMSPFEFAENIGSLFHRRHPTIKQKILAVQKPKKKNRIRKIVDESRQVLKVTNQTNKFSTLCVISLALSLLGIIFATCLDNIFLIPILAVGFGLIPFLYVIYSSARYKKQLNGELQSAMSTVTTSYQRSENLLTAIHETIEHLNPPIRDVFGRFLVRVESVNPDIPAALEVMKTEISNETFQEWVESLILCQRNRSQISTLPFSVSKLSKIRKVTSDMEYDMYKPIKSYLYILAILACLILAVGFMSSEWMGYLLYTMQGKIAMAITALTVLITMVRVISLIQPADYKR